jgi:hypothetical protein
MANLASDDFPSLEALLATEASDPDKDIVKASLASTKDAIVSPAITYFKKRFIDANCILHSEMKLFELARLIAPHSFVLHHASFSAATAVGFCKAIPFLSDLSEAMCEGMLREMPVYTYHAGAFVPPATQGFKKRSEYLDAISEHILSFWRANEALIPHWSSFAARIALCQPSSACVERVFSTLARVASKDRRNMLNDQTELACMLSYNHPN